MRVLGDFRNHDANFFAFCDSEEIEAIFLEKKVQGKVFISKFDRVAHTLYEPYCDIFIQFHSGGTDIIVTKDPLFFQMPFWCLQPFFRNYSVKIAYDLSGNYIQIMDVERCNYPLVRQDWEIQQFSKK